jgi:hypothetical protein
MMYWVMRSRSFWVISWNSRPITIWPLGVCTDDVHLPREELRQPIGVRELAAEQQAARADVLAQALVHDVHVRAAHLAREELVADRHGEGQPDELSLLEIE